MHRSISRTLLYRIIMVSSLVATAFMVVELIYEYRLRKVALENRVNVIKLSALRSVSDAVFHLDDRQTRSVLEGIALVPDVVEVKVLDPDGDVFVAVRHEDAIKSRDIRSVVTPTIEAIGNYLIASRLSDDVTWATVPLTAEEGDKSIPIGELKFSITQKHVYAGLIFNAIARLLSQIIYTIIVAILLFTVCQRLVTRHISAIAVFLRRIDLAAADDEEAKPLELDRQVSYHKDELDTLVLHINEMYVIAKDTLAAKTKEVEHYSNEVKVQQTAAINNARLSSLGQMAGGIAHEINNPLTIIQGHCNLIKKQVANDHPGAEEQLEKSFTRISASIVRISEVTGGLLAFSRDIADIGVGEITIKQLVAKMDNMASLVFAQDHITYSSNNEMGVDKVIHSCEGQILQVVTNLFANARDAALEMPEGKRWVKLHVCEAEGGKMVEITVKDSGNGIKPENHNNIFEPFFTTKPVGSGAGLGLSICHGIAEELGGMIYLNHQETCTSFTLCLPYNKPANLGQDPGGQGSGDQGSGEQGKDSPLPLAS